MERKLITKNDILLIVVIILIIGAGFLLKSFSSSQLVAEVYYDGKIVETVNLTEKEEKKIITGENDSVVVVAEDGKIYFEKSDCPDKVCIKSGELHQNGDFASCLPEKVVIKVSGAKKGNEPDAIVY
ncbi:MAG: NusG domain II-containing protein [Clostridia bacterium]|nr:NusG domain II-containing protein [Clostridia bacterium]